MRWRTRDVAIVVRYQGATCRLTGDEEVEHIKGVEVFNYLGHMLDRYDDDWAEVLHNISKARQM